MNPYFHKPSGSEVKTHSWHYTVIEEGRVSCSAGTALYVLGRTIIGSACCGAGEIRFIYIPGIIFDGADDSSSDGALFSLVQPVENLHIRREIESTMKKMYPMYQITF